MRVEILPEGTVERECAARGERIYRPSELDELLAELRESPTPQALELLDAEQVGALLIERALGIAA